MIRRLAAGLAVLAAAVGASAPPAAAVDDLAGLGESWAQFMVERIITGVTPLIAPTTASFTTIGDDEAREALVDGEVDWAIGGRPLGEEEVAEAAAAGRRIEAVPYSVGAVGIVTAVDVDTSKGGGRILDLKLSVPTLARIFTHQIVSWNDPEILEQNPDLPLLQFPQVLQIFTTVRLDSSESTAALISMFLADDEARPIWNAYATTLGSPADTPLDRWPPDPNTSTKGIGSGSKGMMDTMLSLDSVTGEPVPSAASHHIGYVAPAWAAAYGAPLTAVENKAGEYVLPTQDAVVATANEASTFDPATNRLTFDFTKITGAASYPVVMPHYLLAPVAGMTSATEAAALGEMIEYVFGDAGQQEVTLAGYVPVPAPIRAAGLALAQEVAAQTTPTTTTTTSTTTTSPPAGTGGGGTSVAAGGSRSSGSSSSLPDTGGVPRAPLAAAAAGLVVAGELVRRRARRPAR